MRRFLQQVSFKLLPVIFMASTTLAADPAVVDFSVKPDGKGLFDQLSYRGRAILRQADQPASQIRLTRAADGSLDNLFRHAADLTLNAKIEKSASDNDLLRITGQYTDGKVLIPFTRTIKRDGNYTIEVTDETDFSKIDPSYLVASHQLMLPIVVNADEHQRMFAFAGQHRVEMFRMDGNDVTRRELLISDNRGFMPFWDIGGVLQLPTGYSVWKANHADTMAYPIESGDSAPGWADYSEDDWGMSVKIVDPKQAAPWAIVINARAGDLSIYPFPPSQPARAGAELGVRKITFQLHFHDTSWPAFYPCELEPATYMELLEYLKKKGEPAVTDALSTSNLRLGMVRQRVQPSIVLRSMYRGDNWRMGSILKDIGKENLHKRGGPFADREAAAKVFLDHVKQNGVPTPQGK